MDRSSLLVAGALAAVLQPAYADFAVTQAFTPTMQQPKINCGGHFAETCRACPAQYGEDWCHGECLWAMDKCRPDVPMNHILLFFGDMGGTSFAIALLFLLVAIQIIYAAIFNVKLVAKYPKDIGEKDIEDSQDGDWKTREIGLFSMFKDSSTCLWACFCTPVLAAKNFDVSNVLGFWPSCFLIGCTMYTPLYLVTAILRTLLSARLKRKLNLEPKFCKDCLLSLFCFPCEVGRESLEVDSAEEVEIKCPFNFQSTWSPPLEEKKLDDDEEEEQQVETPEPESRSCTSMLGGGKARMCGGGGEVAEAAADEVQEASSWFSWRSAPLAAPLAVVEEQEELLGAETEKPEEEQEAAAPSQTSWFTWGGTQAREIEETPADAPADEETPTEPAEPAEAPEPEPPSCWAWRTTPAEAPKEQE
jgi:Cys-rich protein (TIGR01571 family)